MLQTTDTEQFIEKLISYIWLSKKHEACLRWMMWSYYGKHNQSPLNFLQLHQLCYSAYFCRVSVHTVKRNNSVIWHREQEGKTCNAGKEPPSLFLVGQKKSNTNEPQIIKSIFCSIDIRSFCIYPLMQESKASVVPQPKALTPVMAPTTTTASCLLLGYRSPAWRNAESRHPSSSIWEHLVSERKKEMKGRIWQWSIIRSF